MKDIEKDLQEQIQKMTQSIGQKIERKVDKQQTELEKQVIEIQKSKENLTKKKSEEFTELTYDIIFDLYKVADELLENISQGRVGQNLNLKLLQLYNRIVAYRKLMVKGIAMVENNNRLDAIQIRKDFKRNFNTNFVKLRNEKTRNRMKKF
ncbi:MAG TPA: hypothetical protein PLH46_04400 [Caldisericia bacterium]|nr:hypothetical protein [Caldisericia bacterium]